MRTAFLIVGRGPVDIGPLVRSLSPHTVLALGDEPFGQLARTHLSQVFACGESFTMAQALNHLMSAVPANTELVMPLRAQDRYEAGTAELAEPLVKAGAGAVLFDYFLDDIRMFQEPFIRLRLLNSPVAPPAVVYSMAAIRRIGKFNEKFGDAPFLDYLLQLSGQFIVLHSPMVGARIKRSQANA